MKLTLFRALHSINGLVRDSSLSNVVLQTNSFPSTADCEYFFLMLDNEDFAVSNSSDSLSSHTKVFAFFKCRELKGVILEKASTIMNFYTVLKILYNSWILAVT